MRSETKLAMENVLDTFTGADGGGHFMSFRHLIEDMESKVKAGDQAAEDVIKILLRFSKLLDTAKRLYK